MFKFLKVTPKLKSIRWIAYFMLVLIGLIPMLIMRSTLVGSYEAREISSKTIDITGQAKLLVAQMSNAVYLENPTSDVIDAQINVMTSVYDGRIMVIDKTFTIIKDTYNMMEGKVITSKIVVETFGGTESSYYDDELDYIELSLPIINQYEKTIEGVLIVVVSTEGIATGLEFYIERANIITLIFLIIVVFISYPLSKLLVRPLENLSEALTERNQGLTTEEISVDSVWETKDLSRKINLLYNSMKVLDESRQEFVSNVSHELKTPITSVKVLADSLLSMEDAPVELYREFLEDITEEIDRESKIIEDLLSLVKMDKGATKPEVTNLNVNELLEAILRRLKPIAEKQEVELVLESFRPVMADLDETKISLAFTNLIENAIKYNRQGGWVHITLNADYQYFYVTIEDSGIGMPQEALDHIFERFYRVDKSHSREIGGTGLGLAITRNSIVLHKGAIKVYSELDKGTTFSVRIPLKYIP